jgi:hypothetical protein
MLGEVQISDLKSQISNLKISDLSLPNVCVILSQTRVPEERWTRNPVPLLSKTSVTVLNSKSW